MPKVLFTAVVADMRGSLSGSTFSKNSGGHFLRSRLRPTGQRSPNQMARSSIFIGITSAWRSLTSEQRTSWNLFAKKHSKIDVFGNNNRKNGFQLYSELNGNLALIGESKISSPVEFISPPAVFVSSIAWIGAPSFAIRAFKTGDDPTGEWVALLAGSIALPPGRSDSNKGLRYYRMSDITSGTHIDFGQWPQTFGLPLPGQRRNTRLVMISKTTGQKVLLFQGLLSI